MKIMTIFLTAVLVALPVTSAVAQTTTDAQRHSIDARENNQQARIAHGVKDGQITPKGAAAAEHRQAKISAEDHSMRQADHGHLTAQDRHTLARQQDRTSKGIYDRNHNQATDPGVAPR